MQRAAWRRYARKPRNQAYAGKQFKPGQDQGWQGYQRQWQYLVTFDDPGELQRLGDFVKAGIDEYPAQDQPG